MNKYNLNIHHRRSIRLKGYNYAQAGLYFVTICTKNRACLFGEIQNKKMNLNDSGKMVDNEWLKIQRRFQNIQLHEYIVMPNHFHAILEIVGATLVVAQNDEVASDKNIDNRKGQQGIAPTGGITKTGGNTPTLGDIIGAFESITTVEYIRGVKNNNWESFNGKLWQRNYWEHIIRNDKSYNRISEYIINNPQNWDNDKLLNKEYN
jgi:REP element-mobilizing transposase RayT